MPEKTNSAKRHSSIAQTLDRFLERVHDEPEHAAHFAQEIPEDPSDLLERNHWRRDQNFFGRVFFLLSHCRREAALVQETEKRKLGPRKNIDIGRSVCSEFGYETAVCRPFLFLCRIDSFCSKKNRRRSARKSKRKAFPVFKKS